MKIKNVKDVNVFLGVVNECTGDVILTSEYGDKYNLKSTLSQYIAIAALLGQHGEELELWCSTVRTKQNSCICSRITRR